MPGIQINVPAIYPHALPPTHYSLLEPETVTLRWQGEVRASHTWLYSPCLPGVSIVKTNQGGVFAQRGHSANYYGDYPGNNPENHPPCGIMHNQFKTQKFKHLMLAMGPRDLHSAPYSPVHCSSHSMTSFQSSELTELPVVENSQLFAQRVHSARYAPQ